MPHTVITQDLFGYADILAVKPGHPTLAIQVTSAANFAARCKKVKASEAARICTQCGWTIEVHGWRQLKGQPWSPMIVTFGPETWSQDETK